MKAGMKIAVIIYHKNIRTYVDDKIVQECLESIREQTFDIFDILELDYSDLEQSANRLIDDSFEQESFYFRKECRNHIEAMNYLLTKAFDEFNYDYVFNVNIDDVYDTRRVEYQLRKMLCDGYDIVGSNYIIFKSHNQNIVQKQIKILQDSAYGIDEQSVIKIQSGRKKCIVPLSSICFSKKSWKAIQKIDMIPTLESLLMFKKLFRKNMKVHICKEFLLKYRMHDNQVSANYRRKMF